MLASLLLKFVIKRLMMNKPEFAITLQEMGQIKHIHFIGIGGTGMSGIAEVLFNLGYQVSGSDLKVSSITQRFIGLGMKIYFGHNPANIGCADVVVISTAIDQINVEVDAAHHKRIPVIPRAEMLAELMRFRYGIALAGTHGKTTTTSLVASILAEGGLDPTFVIGGRLNSTGVNAGLGLGHYLVAEADESDASFLHLQPMLAVVTNIDRDHMETYDGDYQKLQNTFIKFLHNLPFYGLAVLCIDDAGVQDILPHLTKPFKTYGVSEKADIRAFDIVQQGMQTSFKVKRWGRHTTLEIMLNLPGLHNVLNALAAIAIATNLDISDQVISNSLQAFKGIGRRFQINGKIAVKGGMVTLVDDYGHHPREITATLASLQQVWPTRRAIIVFQPHRYTRTYDLFEDFIKALSSVDVLIMLNVYTAGEVLIAGADSQALCAAIKACSQVDPILIENHDELATILANIILPEDIVLTLGAGNVGQIAAQLPKQLHIALGQISTDERMQ